MRGAAGPAPPVLSASGRRRAPRAGPIHPHRVRQPLAAPFGESVAGWSHGRPDASSADADEIRRSDVDPQDPMTLSGAAARQRCSTAGLIRTTGIQATSPIPSSATPGPFLNIGDLAAFQRFVGPRAGRTSQLLNLSSLGADTGIRHATAGHGSPCSKPATWPGACSRSTPTSPPVSEDTETARARHRIGVLPAMVSATRIICASIRCGLHLRDLGSFRGC